MTRTCERLAPGDVEALFYGDLAPADRAQVEMHVRACDACQALLDDLALIRDALAARPSPSAPAGGDWTAFMARLGDAIARDQAGAMPAAPRVLSWPAAAADAAGRTVGGMAPATDTRTGADVPARVRWSPRSLAAAAALIALATLGTLVAARATRFAAPPAMRAAVAPVPAADGADTRAFEAVTEEHFERSKLVVLGLASKDPARTGPSGWGYERGMAGKLLGDTRMYRMAAEDRGLGTIAAVMRDLELVLLEATFTDDRDPASLAQIQRLIRRRDLVEKLDAVSAMGL